MEFEFEKIHLVALAITAVVILYADWNGYRYLRGKTQTIDPQIIRWVHPMVWIGLITMIATGIAMVVPTWMYRLQDPAFFMKMGFVGVLVFNAFAIGKFAHVATERPFSALLPSERRTLLISGAISWCGWLGAGIIGYFFL